MASLKQVAEQAWRMYYPSPTDDASNKLMEFQLLASQALAEVCQLYFYIFNDEGDKILNEVWLQKGVVTVEEKDCLWQFCLPMQPISLRGDVGLYRVAPNKPFAQPYTKSSQNMTDMLGQVQRYRYYRIGRIVYFPDGLIGNIKEIAYTYAGLFTMDCDEGGAVPDDFAPKVIERIIQLFTKGGNKAQDKLADSVDQTRST